jgi:Cytochrome c7 and related cytochrome c
VNNGSDQGFILGLLASAVVALGFLHLSLGGKPPVLAVQARAGCESCHVVDVDKNGPGHPPLGDHAFNARDPHRAFATCTECHGGDARGKTVEAALHERMNQGDVLTLQCMLCHTPRSGPGLLEERQHWANARCGSCHRDMRVSGEKKAPTLDHLDDKLTREFVFRYITAPQSLASQGEMGSLSGTHGIAGEGVVVEAKAYALTSYLLNGARQRKSEGWKPPAALPDFARTNDIIGAGCLSCHEREDFVGQGTKTNAAWLGGFLPKHTSLAKVESDTVAATLAAMMHPTFEGHFPTLTRQLDAALREQARVHEIEDIAAVDVWAKPLGAALFVYEGCAHCHDKSGVKKPPAVPLLKPLTTFEGRHRALKDDAALMRYVEAILFWEKNRKVDLLH